VSLRPLAAVGEYDVVLSAQPAPPYGPGFTVEPGTDDSAVVAHVVPGSQAAALGLPGVGDVLVGLNGYNVMGQGADNVAKLLAIVPLPASFRLYRRGLAVAAAAELPAAVASDTLSTLSRRPPADMAADMGAGQWQLHVLPEHLGGMALGEAATVQGTRVGAVVVEPPAAAALAGLVAADDVVVSVAGYDVANVRTPSIEKLVMSAEGAFTLRLARPRAGGPAGGSVCTEITGGSMAGEVLATAVTAAVAALLSPAGSGAVDAGDSRRSVFDWREDAGAGGGGGGGGGSDAAATQAECITASMTLPYFGLTYPAPDLVAAPGTAAPAPGSASAAMRDNLLVNADFELASLTDLVADLPRCPAVRGSGGMMGYA